MDGPRAISDMDEDLPPNIESPDYWRTRAEEARTLSEQMGDTQTKALMLGSRKPYERIAKAYETKAPIDEPRDAWRRVEQSKAPWEHQIIPRLAGQSSIVKRILKMLISSERNKPTGCEKSSRGTQTRENGY